ncbi:EamA family transporter RarD [Paracoccus sp. MBLB3053]|uniref:EamA family transporter RarD n=1 Tax=Paracoccus aurantius TaxID=3073814 RepID=A0ABU2HQ25_9RHOB|nr:EamA family transporter RarD [Paracoccus sp. MBLB3053]MDS9467146.1 EamA family transporter RarD [Paracoccus sp. MBLB3053]
MTEWSKGFWAMVLACVVWGFCPLFYHLMVGVPVLEVLAFRTLFSLVFFVFLLAAQGRVALLREALSGPHLPKICLAALVISLNWGIFIWAVQSGHVVESSLGYYIFPLVAVLAGVLAFGERLSTLQRFAIGLAAFAVALLSWGLGAAPWISLVLAISFGLYGVVKKTLPMGPVVSVACEVAILGPIALGWLLLQGFGALPDPFPQGLVFGTDLRLTLLLISSGVVTALPLILFSYATRRVGMATIGIMQYINPTLQFFCAVAIFGETVTGWHMIAFPLIWLALALYSAPAIRRGAFGLRQST